MLRNVTQTFLMILTNFCKQDKSGHNLPQLDSLKVGRSMVLEPGNPASAWTKRRKKDGRHNRQICDTRLCEDIRGRHQELPRQRWIH